MKNVDKEKLTIFLKDTELVSGKVLSDTFR